MEEAGKSAEAATAYQKALAASPGNLIARVGYHAPAPHSLPRSP